MDSTLKRILWSMAKNEYLNQSSQVCAYISHKVEKGVRGDKPKVKQANFYVLREAAMPAVLVEFDYLSNPVSEIRLRSPHYREKIVVKICEGISSYESFLNHTTRKNAS